MHQRVSSLQLRRQRAPAVSPAYLLLLCLLLGPLPPSKRRCDAIDDVSGRRGDDAAPATAVVVAGGLGLALAGNVDQQPVPHSDDDEDDDDGSDEDKFSDNELPVDNKSPTAPADNETADEAQTRHIVNILVQLQKQVESNVGLKHTEEEEKLVDSLLEGDIRLTVQQAQQLLTDVRKPRRRKRKLAEPASKRWKLPIPYMFDGSHNSTERRRIKDALAYWEELTCVTFTENSKAPFKLVFVKQSGCWSHVGFTGMSNQTISIGDGCQSNGTIAHEIGHAVGFWHEQSRPDRNNYVVVHEENISEGKLYNFQTRTWGEIIVLGVPYDLGSGMHYGAKFYAKDVNGTLTTLETRDPLMMRVIGQRQELSFYDVKLANKAYCDNICRSYGIRLFRPCKRDGYQDPKNCWRCRCPDGFGGNYCETVASGVNAYCGGVLDARYNGTIYSPGYPSPGYRQDIHCSWLIKAPEHSHVYLEFVDYFGITGHSDLCTDFVEVRYNTSLALTGARFCVTDPPRQTLRSDSNEMLVLFRSYDHSLVCDEVQFPWKCYRYNIGFKAKFYTKSCGGCGNVPSVTAGTQPACVRRSAYTCAQMWEEKVKIECPAWWKSDSCGTRTVNKIRYVTCYRDQPFCCKPSRVESNQCVRSVNESPDENNAVMVTKLSRGSDGRVLLPIRRRKGPGAKQMSRPTPRQLPRSAPSPAVRPAKPPSLPVYLWTDWSDWSNCSRRCGGGVSVRTRRCFVRGTCGNNNIQVDKKPCATLACFDKCPVQKQILCNLWATCIKTVMEKCNPRCYDGFTLDQNRCMLNTVT